MPELNIPFDGFYNSIFSDLVDREQESFCECEHEKELEEYPSELCISESDFGEITYSCLNYFDAYQVIAREYVESFDVMAGELLGETRTRWIHSWADKCKKRAKVDSCGMSFNLMTSPREYNFETDRLFVNVSQAFVNRLFKMSKDEQHKTLAETIRQRFTSYDGFSSHYSNNLENWLDTPLVDWDHNELGTLLVACLDLSGGFESWNVYEGLTDESYIYFDNAMDWESFEVSKLEKRVELLEEWLNDDFDGATNWCSLNGEKARAIIDSDPDSFKNVEWPNPETLGGYRCQKTSDLFETTL